MQLKSLFNGTSTTFPILFLLSFLFIIQCSTTEEAVHFQAIPLKLDQEMMIDSSKALNSGTQSINRYHSVLRDQAQLEAVYAPGSGVLSFHMGDNDSSANLGIHNIDIQFLVPLLPYSHADSLDDFDKANLLLAEYARNGISLSYHEDNSAFAYFRSKPAFFNEDGEFIYSTAGEIMPNAGVKPKRMSVVNNCLDPGLWEINASDAVGEMYHAWFNMPPELYYELIRDQNQIATSTAELRQFMEHPPGLDHIPLDLNRFRKVEKEWMRGEVNLAKDKKIGAYSTQDSRRKVQRKFYSILRDSLPIQPGTMGEMQEGDLFDLHSFKAPGIYDAQTRTQVPFEPHWNQFVIRTVEPKTTYGGEHDGFDKHGYIELELISIDGQRSLVAGNIPIQLLVFSEDYKIPAFGVGVLASSELVERRFLRLQSSSYPHYAYLAKNQDGQQFLLNNHPLGYEQIYIRPFIEGEQVYLRCTLVSYERIIDLMEVNIPLDEALGTKIKTASAEYQPPIYEVYTDTNIL